MIGSLESAHEKRGTTVLHFALTMLVISICVSLPLATFAMRKKHARWIAVVLLIAIVGWVAAVYWYSENTLRFLLLMLVLFVYLGPTLAAFAARKKHAIWIELVNLIPFVGWVAAVIWYWKDTVLPRDANTPTAGREA